MAFAPVCAQAQDQSAPAAGEQNAQADIQQPEWQKVCGTVNEKEECQVGRKRLAATGQPIAEFLIIEREDKKLLQISVPPIVLIQPGIKITIDEDEPTTARYVVCTPGQCLAMGEINDEIIGKLKRGGNVVITMLNPQGQAVNFDISLVGFTAVYDGPGIDPDEAQARQQRLEDELKRKADEARQKLMQLQQKTSTE
jgi:invasion protein IalB